MVRGSKFQIWEVERLYYLHEPSENKSTDQMRSYKSNLASLTLGSMLSVFELIPFGLAYYKPKNRLDENRDRCYINCTYA